jgi:hypothetical protein
LKSLALVLLLSSSVLADHTELLVVAPDGTVEPGPALQQAADIAVARALARHAVDAAPEAATSVVVASEPVAADCGSGACGMPAAAVYGHHASTVQYRARYTSRPAGVFRRGVLRGRGVFRGRLGCH